MKKDSIADGKISSGAAGLGTVTPEMIRQRAAELALNNGRSAQEMLPADVEQATQELLGATPDSPDDSGADSIPATQRWNPTPEDRGRQTLNHLPADEENIQRRMVEDGAAEAEHENRIEATRESLKQDEQTE